MAKVSKGFMAKAGSSSHYSQWSVDHIECVEVKSVEEWRNWLEQNHATRSTIWLVTYKKSVPEFYVSWEEVVGAALCYGWIDSRVRKLDDQRTMVLVSPRNPKSNWSRVNKNLVEKLIAEGQMQAPGLAAIELAKANGTWTALDDVENLVIPPDLVAEFDNLPGARAQFESFPRSSRRAALEWLLSAKTPETRQKRIVRIVSEANEGRRTP